MRTFALLLALLSWGAPAFAQNPPAPTQPTVELRISVNGKAVLGEVEFNKRKFEDEKQEQAAFDAALIPLRQGASLQLKVELVDKAGKAMDITKDTHLEYHSSKPWGLSVSPNGLVSAKGEPQPQDTVQVEDTGLGGITFVYSNGTQIGWNRVLFDIAPRG